MRQVIRATVAVYGLLVVLILVMRLLPNEDAEIRRLVLPPADCAAPCFMYIRAGITDSVSGARLITAHEWTTGQPFFVRPIDDINTRYVYWQWSGAQPAGVDSLRPGKMRVYRDRIAGVVVRTRLPLGALWLVLGATDRGTISLPEMRSDTDRMFILVYPKVSLLARVVVSKRATTRQIWTSMVEIESANGDSITYFGGYQLPSLARWSHAG